MSRENYTIFSEGKIGNMVIKNRLIRSATNESGMTEDGRVTNEILGLYKELAAGGVGMIITGHMAVKSEGKLAHKQICIYDNSYVDDIAQIAKVVHESGNGCKIVAQLSHPGRQVFYDNKTTECVGPSDVPSPVLKNRAKLLSVEDIQNIINCFVDAIIRVKKAGYDGVQLHAAHGYLLSSFLSPYTNNRTDQYGGSLKNRVNILREIITKAKKRVNDFPIMVKMNCDDHIDGGIDKDIFPGLAKEIELAGIDAIEVSGGMWDCLARKEKELGFFCIPLPEARTRINSSEKQSYFLKYTENIDLGIPVILVGGHRDVENLEKIINKKTVNYISMSRPLICEPDLPNRWVEGLGSNKAFCVSCNSCILEVKYALVKCVLKQNKLKQKLVKNIGPLTWKYIFK